MELVLNHPDKGPIEPAKDLAAVLVCEDPLSAPRGCALLKRVARKAGAEGRLIYNWWTFGVLASASLRELAANESAAADMVIVVAREGHGLPEAVKDWISLWFAAGEYHPRPRALVALLEPDKEQNRPSRGLLSDLKQLAAAGGVDFFANGKDTGWGDAVARSATRPSGNSSRCARRGGARIAGRSEWVPAAAQGEQYTNPVNAHMALYL